MKNDFQTSLSVKKPIMEVFAAITKMIPKWWSMDYEGAADQVGNEFTVRFGNTFKTMRIESVSLNKEIVWRCVDQHLEMPGGMEQLTNKREWVGNKLIWKFSQTEDITTIHFTHEGLAPNVECWSVCEQGWDQTFISLKNLLVTGKGNPFVVLDKEHLRKAKNSY